MTPERYPRRCLLCVSGLSPQIVTETLYALAVRQQPPFIPTEIHLLTTAEGAERARLTLLSQEPGWFYRLCADYALPPIHFPPEHIHILHDAAGQPLRDIRDVADNEAIADAILAQVRERTADPACAVHASIAGGRKTMGFYLGYALSLLGRPQDRLSHVLVSSPFETNAEFFYPSPAPRVFFTPPPDLRPLDAHTAEVTLAEIPFVRLRDGLHEHLLAPRASFSAVVAQAQRNLAAPRLRFTPATGQVQCGETAVDLPPIDFAFYAWLAKRAQAGQPGVCRNQLTAAEAADFLAEYTARQGEMAQDVDRVAAALRTGMEPAYFDNRRTGIHRRLIRALGSAGAQPYLIHSDQQRPRSRYALSLGPDQIRFGATADDADDDKLVGPDGNSLAAYSPKSNNSLSGAD